MTRKDMATKQLEKHMLLMLIRPRDKKESQQPTTKAAGLQKPLLTSLSASGTTLRENI